MKTLQTALLLLLPVVLNAGEQRLPEALTTRLTAAIREHCPDAAIEADDSGFTARHGTMMFTLHGRSKTGEVHPQTYQAEGPNFRGFLLRISRQEGPYEGAAVVPQTLREPYFPTFIDAPATADGSGHYWVRFSFGGRLDDKTKNAILDAIPKTVFQPGPPSSGEEPVHPNTDPTSGAIGASR
ncbi:MAG: hypothetical protein H7A45_05365 [Verrucomicrobiales bacterium]|nr:hypothetical protein [Verrucomicrobiales bacterium]